MRHAYQPPITRTCRLLRAELLPLFYKTHVRARIHRGIGRGFESKVAWLKAIGPENRKLVAGVEVVAIPRTVVKVGQYLESKLGLKVKLGGALEEFMESGRNIYPVSFE